MIAVAQFPTLLRFPLGGAQEELKRVSRMFRAPMGDGVFVAPMGETAAASNVLASVPWVAQWKFNNNGNDSIGANTLTNNNSATFTTGKLGGATGATQLVRASTQYWSVADNATLSMGNLDFTVAAWCYLDSLGGFRSIAVKGRGSADNTEFSLDKNSSDVFRFFVSDGSTLTIATASSFGSVTTGVWYCVIGWYDSVLDTVNICVNDGVIDSAANSTGAFDSSEPFTVGANADTVSAFDGRIDNVCIAKGSGAILTTAQRAAFYNGGAGTETLT